LRLLQQNLDEIPFEDLDCLISELTDSEREIRIYDDKEFLSKLFIPLQGADNLHRKAYRKELLQYLDEETVDQFCHRHGIGTELSFREKIESISNMPWGKNEHSKEFLKIFDFPQQYLPETTEEIPSVETIQPPPDPFKQLFNYQANIVYRGIKELGISNNRFLIQLPTGSGKTRVAVEILSHFFNTTENKNILWLTNREELCEQVIESFKETWGHIGQKEIPIYRYWGGHNPSIDEEKCGFIVGSFQKIWSSLKSESINFIPGVIVIDEAHMAIAPTYKDTIESIRDIFVGTRIIGLTATPGRSYEDWEENRALSDYFGNKILTVENETGGVIRYLQREKILSVPVYEPLHTELDFELDETEVERLAKEFDYPKSFLERIARDYGRNLKISKKLIEIAERELKTLFFACSVEQSKMLCALMVYLGVPAAHVDGSTSKESRRNIIEKFEKGDITLLFNYNVFSTGFDVPNIDAIFVARPTSSIVQYSQMLGRGMRGPKMGGTDSFVLVDVIDNIQTYGYGLDNIYEYFTEYWESV